MKVFRANRLRETMVEAESRRRRLLLVDDDQFMLLLCRRFFDRTAPDLDLVMVESGEAAIERLRSEPFDIVLSDYRMGRVTGTEVLEFTMTQQPDAVRVLMSGYGDPQMVARAKERAKIHAFVEKPIAVNDIEAALRREVLVPFIATPIAVGKG